MRHDNKYKFDLNLRITLQNLISLNQTNTSLMAQVKYSCLAVPYFVCF